MIFALEKAFCRSGEVRWRSLERDASRMVPHSKKWIEYWDRQFFLYLTGQDSNAVRRASVEEFRAVMKYSDSPESLVGSIPPHREDGSR